MPSPFDAWNDIEPPSSIDRLLHSLIGRVTFGLSPNSLALAYADWALHFVQSPGKWMRLSEKTVRKQARLMNFAVRSMLDADTPPCIEPLPQDRRFRDAAWQRWPFRFIYQAFLLQQQWWHNATTGIGGIKPHHEQVVAFATRQLLDFISPVNFILTNPKVLDATQHEGGMNLLRGAMNFFADTERSLENKPSPESRNFLPGKQVAATKGSIVYRNQLIELIQYAPLKPEVHAEPILIVPAWIMKYYILDLSPHNSLVRYLLEHGHAVFMISWHNPQAADRNSGMDDYLRLGVFEAINAVQAIVPARQINAVGYCLGGTLLSIAAAYFTQIGDQRLRSLTLLAAQTDFSEAGELMLFIDDSQLNLLEDIMWDQGYLDNRQMAGAFQLLRSHDLVWSMMVNGYLLGQQRPMTDLMAWNADATRMPYRMHSEYLRRFFLNNDLFGGRYKVDGRPVALSDIHVPVFAVATESDHIAPWRSVYKFNLVADTDVSFVLTSGGHNAGIISEPDRTDRHYRISEHCAREKYMDPEDWYQVTPETRGSWWPAWVNWLARRSSTKLDAPQCGAPSSGYPPLGPAPGRYVCER
jgi:polyhydroxyalkanoate synthase